MFGIRRSSGFTLLELLITITILAIVATLAVPSFREMVVNNRLAAQTNEVSSIISFARSEASKLGAGVVTVCTSSDSASCSGSSNWENGLIVFRDVDMDRVVDATDQLLKVNGALAGGNTLRIRDMTSDGGSFVQFDSEGFPRASATDETAGTFIICDDRGAVEASAVSINFSGQANLARDTDADGILNDHKRNNISCP